MKTPHIVVTADTWGGVWTFALELAYQLRRKNWQVTLACLGKHPDLATQKKLRSWNVEYSVAAFRLEWMPDSQAEVQSARNWLRDLLRVRKPDLLHANQFCFIGLLDPYRELLTVHSDLISWWRHTRGTAAPSDGYHAFYQRLARQSLQTACRVTAPTRAAAQDLTISYGITRPVIAVPNGLTPAFFHPFQDKQSYAFAAGRWWDAGKQLSWLAEQDWPIPVMLAGPDQAPGMAAQATHTSPHNQKLGEIDARQMRQWLAHAEVFVSASRYEPFGLAVLEAALSRCLLVLSDLPGQRELWGDRALYFPAPPDAGAQEGLRMHLAWQQAAPKAARKCAERVYRHALRNYTGVRMAEQYITLYRELLEMRRETIPASPWRPAADSANAHPDLQPAPAPQ